jgi:hypothetical protein
VPAALSLKNQLDLLRKILHKLVLYYNNTYLMGDFSHDGYPFASENVSVVTKNWIIQGE